MDIPIRCPSCGVVVHRPSDGFDVDAMKLAFDEHQRVCPQPGALTCPRCHAAVFRLPESGAPTDRGAIQAAFDEHASVCVERRPGLVCPYCTQWVVTDDAGTDPDDDAIREAIARHQAICVDAPAPTRLEDLADLPGSSLLERLWSNVLQTDEDALLPEQRAFYHAEHLNMEVGNGGLVQYFMNTRGEEIADARNALATIRADYHGEVFERAVAIWEQERSVPGSCWARELDDRAFTESRIAELDEEWEVEDLTALELRYAQANPSAFVRDTL